MRPHHHSPPLPRSQARPRWLPKPKLFTLEQKPPLQRWGRVSHTKMVDMNQDTEMAQEHLESLYDIELGDTPPPQSPPPPPPTETVLVAETQALRLETETPAGKMGLEACSSKVSRVQLCHCIPNILLYAFMEYTDFEIEGNLQGPK